MTIAAGKDTSEHRRALRAEICGYALILTGLAIFLIERHGGIWFCAIGALLVGWTASSYARARGDVKAAAVRRPHDSAPRTV